MSQIEGSLGNFIKIFKDHVAASPDIEYFVYGEADQPEVRLLSDKLIAFPLLWLEEPQIIPERNRTNLYTNTFNFGFSVMRELPHMADFDDIINGFDLAHAALDKVIGMLWKIHRENFILEVKGLKKENIDRRATPDEKLVGWRCQCEIMMQSTFIHRGF